jgi:hypothetical protein
VLLSFGAVFWRLFSHCSHCSKISWFGIKDSQENLGKIKHAPISMVGSYQKRSARVGR